jgi:opacity protein-like surface antigen
MKSFLSLITISLFLMSSFAYAQCEKGNVELSLIGTAGSLQENEEYESRKQNGDSQKYLMAFFRSGYFLTDNISIEPELSWTAMDETKPALNICGNITYNLPNPNSVIIPFVLAGYGVGNGIPINHTIFGRSTKDMDIKLLNIGAGAKFKLGKKAALRVEYRFQKFSFESSYREYYYDQYYDTKVKYTLNFNNIFFGFSVFLK